MLARSTDNPVSKTHRNGSEEFWMSVPNRWGIIQVRLDEPLCAMNAPRDGAGGYLVFWWKDVPLGHALVHAASFRSTKRRFSAQR
jgi:hypothetical protein